MCLVMVSHLLAWPLCPQKNLEKLQLAQPCTEHWSILNRDLRYHQISTWFEKQPILFCFDVETDANFGLIRLYNLFLYPQYQLILIDQQDTDHCSVSMYFYCIAIINLDTFCPNYCLWIVFVLWKCYHHLSDSAWTYSLIFVRSWVKPLHFSSPT